MADTKGLGQQQLRMLRYLGNRRSGVGTFMRSAEALPLVKRGLLKVSHTHYGTYTMYGWQDFYTLTDEGREFAESLRES